MMVRRRSGARSEDQGERSAKNYAFDAVARKNVELTMAEIRSRSAVIAALETKGAVKIAGAMYSLESAAAEFLPSPRPYTGSSWPAHQLSRGGQTAMQRTYRRLVSCLLFGASLLCMAAPSVAQQNPPAASDGVLGAMAKSLTGDVYGDPSAWRELSLRDFFSEGWDRAWVSPPTGGGGAPRQGWLNAFDGVFYRLGVATYGYAQNFLENGNQHSGLLQFYLPLNQRFELRVDIPVAVSNRGAFGNDYETNFGDLQIVGRFLLSETRDVTQSFNVAFRAPTGSTDNVNGVAAITPTYEFWTNWWKGLVLRGGAGFFVPYGHQSIDEVGVHASFIANLAVGYYFTPHTATPFGDLVFYLSANLAQTIDGPSTNTFSLTPGFRTHLGANWYLLGAVEVPVTSAKAFDFQVLGALMKVF